MNDEPQFLRYNRRWYDSIANLAMAVHVSRQLPPEIQGLIARNLNETIDQQRELRRTDNNAYSIGLTRMLGLYKSSNRQRWYDPHYHLHRAFTHMSGVPDELLSDFAERVLDVHEYVKAYLANRSVRLPDPLHMAETVETILQKTYVGLEEDGRGIRVVSNGVEIHPDASAHSRRHIVPTDPRRARRPHPRQR